MNGGPPTKFPLLLPFSPLSSTLTFVPPLGVAVAMGLTKVLLTEDLGLSFSGSESYEEGTLLFYS